MSQFAEYITEPQIDDPIRFVMDTFLPSVWQPRRKDMLFVGEAINVPFTPASVMASINKLIPAIRDCQYDTKIVVFYTVEWAILLEAMGFEDITLVTTTFDPLLEKESAKYNYKYVTAENIDDMKRFDVALGNPPYTKLAKGKTTGKTTSKSLWVDFTELAWNMTKYDGIVAFVTPASWIHQNSRAHGIVVEQNELLFSRVYAPHENPFRGEASTSASYWGIRKCKKSKNKAYSFTLNMAGKSYTIDQGQFIPASPDNFDTALSILDKVLNAQGPTFNTVVTSKYHTQSKKRWISKEQTEEFKYPIFHSNTVTLWTNQLDDLHSTPKLLISKKGSINPARVDTTHCVSQNTTCIVTSTVEEAQVAETVVKSKLYKFIMEAIRVNAGLPSEFFKNMPAVDLTRDWTLEQLYAHFNLTNDEVTLIEETIT